MQIGIQIPDFSWPGGPAALRPLLAEIGRAVDAGGFASLWVMDHWFQIPIVGPAEHEMLDGYGALHYLAGVTERVELGTLVSGVTYRHPGLLIKTVSTLDVLSGGRAWLGIGAAWFEREHRGLGVPFPSLGERFERLEETLRIAEQMWSDDDGPFEGSHYRLAETLCVPRPLRRPRPPILIGGAGERKTLRLVARYADACNLFAFAGRAELRRKLEVLARHCEELGRDPAEILRTALAAADFRKEEPGDVIERCRGLAEIGIQKLIFSIAEVERIAPLERFAVEVIPAVAEL